MKNPIILILLGVSLLPSINAYAQQDSSDVLYLKNGSMVRGQIIQRVSNDFVKIRLDSGEIVTYSYSHIAQIALSPNSRVLVAEPQTSDDTPPRAFLTLFGGVNFPTGDFSSTTREVTSGYAVTGWSAGIRYMNFILPSGFLSVGGSISFNPVNETEVKKAAGLHPSTPITFSQYRTIAFLLGLGTGVPPPKSGFYLVAYGGIILANTPEISAGGGRDEGLSSTAFAYGAALGLMGSQMDFALRILSSNPEYEFGGNKYTQPTSLIQIIVGRSF